MRRRDAGDETGLRLSTEQAARVLGVSRTVLISLLEARRLPYTRTPGGHRRIELAALRAFAKRERVKAERAFSAVWRKLGGAA